MRHNVPLIQWPSNIHCPAIIKAKKHKGARKHTPDQSLKRIKAWRADEKQKDIFEGLKARQGKLVKVGDKSIKRKPEIQLTIQPAKPQTPIAKQPVKTPRKRKLISRKPSVFSLMSREEKLIAMSSPGRSLSRGAIRSSINQWMPLATHGR